MHDTLRHLNIYFTETKMQKYCVKKKLSTPHDSIACRSTFTNNWKQTFSHLI